MRCIVGFIVFPELEEKEKGETTLQTPKGEGNIKEQLLGRLFQRSDSTNFILQAGVPEDPQLL